MNCTPGNTHLIFDFSPAIRIINKKFLYPFNVISINFFEKLRMVLGCTCFFQPRAKETRNNKLWIPSIMHTLFICIEWFQVTSQLRHSFETCGKNLWHLYCIAHKMWCNSFLSCCLLLWLWWYGYLPIRNLWLLKIWGLTLDGGFCEGVFLARQLWVTVYIVNDTLNWNTATVCRYGIILLGIMVYSDRLLNRLVQYTAEAGLNSLLSLRPFSQACLMSTSAQVAFKWPNLPLTSRQPIVNHYMTGWWVCPWI